MLKLKLIVIIKRVNQTEKKLRLLLQNQINFGN